MIAAVVEQWLGPHLWALIAKETREILRNKHLIFLLLVPPIIQLLILGAALDPQVRNLSIGIVDYARSHESRDLTAILTNSGVFPRAAFFDDDRRLGRELERAHVDLGIVIPPEFTDDIDRRTPAPVQVLVDGSDAYSAGLASGYILRTLEHFRPSTASMQPAPRIDPQVDVLYNPGLLSSWYFVPGVLGATLTLTATLVASATVLRERESGTMEQLLMTPAADWEILLAKILPLVMFLLADVVLAVCAARLIFGLPFRGSFIVFLCASALYVFVGIGLGMLLGTVCRSQRQAQLASFFINIPLIQLSGTVVPFDTMPALLQTLAVLDPLRYYAIIARSVILKGAGLSILWPQLLLLALFSALMLTFSVTLFRRQLV